MEIPSQHGRTAIVTGANSGIGFETAAALAAAGARTVLACRDESRAGAARAQIQRRHPEANVDVVRLDLGDLTQLAAAAEESMERFGPIHLCVNNAGGILRSRSVTSDGFETTFGVNHLGHFAWTAHLLPSLLAASNSRVVSVSSLAHLRTTMDWDDIMGERGYRPTIAYRRSKLANLLHSFELHRRLASSDHPGAADTIAVAAHPGITASSFWENAAGPRSRWAARALNASVGLMFSNAAQGAGAVVHAATSPGVEAGCCYGPRIAQRWGRPDRVEVSSEARDPGAADRLWCVSEELTGVRGEL